MITVAGKNICMLNKVHHSHKVMCDWLFSRMDRQRREDELKNRGSKKAHEAEQSLLNRVSMILFSQIIFLRLLSH